MYILHIIYIIYTIYIIYIIYIYIFCITYFVVIAIFKSHRAVIIGMYNWNCSHRHRQTAQTATSKFRAGKRFAPFADVGRWHDDRDAASERQHGNWRRRRNGKGRMPHAKRCCCPDNPAATGRGCTGIVRLRRAGSGRASGRAASGRASTASDNEPVERMAFDAGSGGPIYVRRRRAHFRVQRLIQQDGLAAF